MNYIENKNINGITTFAELVLENFISQAAKKYSFK